MELMSECLGAGSSLSDAALQEIWGNVEDAFLRQSEPLETFLKICGPILVPALRHWLKYLYQCRISMAREKPLAQGKEESFPVPGGWMHIHGQDIEIIETVRPRVLASWDPFHLGFLHFNDKVVGGEMLVRFRCHHGPLRFHALKLNLDTHVTRRLRRRKS